MFHSRQGIMKSRDYKCPCGKTYLSYAALFTHIQRKHQGKVKFRILRHLEKYNNLKKLGKKGEDQL